MRILVCNDDGIGAPGLLVLADAARMLTPDVWIVAPERKWTAASHQLSFDRDLSLTRVAEPRIRLLRRPRGLRRRGDDAALRHERAARPRALRRQRSDQRRRGPRVFGDMAVAREGTVWGVPAMALSADGPGSPVPRAAPAIGSLLRVLWERRAEWWVRVLAFAQPAAEAAGALGAD
jgi:5'-nucleotidase